MNAVRFQIVGGDYEHGGAASRSLKEQLKKVGADPAAVRRAMIAAYEAEMNVVIHATRGVLKAELDNGRLDVEITDEGPGIADIEAALRPGFSTASAQARALGFGAGMGLPNIRKNSDQFAIESTVGRGTTIRFSIVLRPEALYGTGRHSLHLAPEKCKQSFRCLHACPTQALRVFRGKPEVLDYLCIDCTACIAACPSNALSCAGMSDELRAQADALLVIAEAALAQFGPGVRPVDVTRELAAMGQGEIWTTAAAEAALRAAVVRYAREESPVRPVISPACPAVTNLIQTKFPSLIPHLAPFGSAMQALVEECGGRRAFFVVTCPGQRTLLNGDGAHQRSAVTPAALRAAIAPRIRAASTCGRCDESRSGEAPRLPDARGRTGETPRVPATARQSRARESPEAQATCTDGGVLRVSGWRHVLRVLDAIEDGLAGDLVVVEPWACDEGCFGSPLLTDDAFLARHRRDAIEAEFDVAGPAPVVRRATAFAARPGLRLDSDMTKAIQKLARMDKIRRSLPGSDCGWCGAPTCAALAEDIVRGRAAPDACVRQTLEQEVSP